MRFAVALLATALAAPALAETAAADAGAGAPLAATPRPIPALLAKEERDQWRAIFLAIRAGAWMDAAQRIDAQPDGPLKYFARAELYTEKGSPKVELEPLLGVLGAAPWLPQAPQLAQMAIKRGAAEPPALPAFQKFVWLGSAPVRARASTVKEDPAAAQIAPKILPLIKIDDPAGCEAILAAEEPNLSGEALTEWRQRVAWSYYLNGDDANARRLAELAQQGHGEWKVQADWTVGLAAWRQRDYRAAASAFAAVARGGGDVETRAAGHYWTARADMAAGHPEKVQARLRAAALNQETFYGLLAAQALGLATQPIHDYDKLARDWDRLASVPNVRLATMLVELGEGERASTVLRHQARIGRPQDHSSLAALAARLNLPDTQLYLAHNGPQGAQPSVVARYPTPEWTPDGGWRVERELIYAHALQESRFRPDVVSPAGAYGIMQVMPGTADLIARRRGQGPVDRTLLLRPTTNLEYGQARLEQVRDYAATGGLLPKVIAGYNAGPGMLDVWNARVKHNGDPLLFMESIPFWETRGYVATVMRNYWMYQRNNGKPSLSLKAMAQGMWPRFPGMTGAYAVRQAAPPPIAAPVRTAEAETELQASGAN
jgi:soluble lytic murein transglycosylase